MQVAASSWTLRAMCLQDIKPFETPRLDLEQYPTGVEIAARMLYTVSVFLSCVMASTLVFGMSQPEVDLCAAWQSTGLYGCKPFCWQDYFQASSRPKFTKTSWVKFVAATILASVYLWFWSEADRQKLEAQKACMQIASVYEDFDGCTVLDVGCGTVRHLVYSICLQSIEYNYSFISSGISSWRLCEEI